ncbi:MAG: hypothetical protein WCX28_03300 [Bacteriovoracaceae bacterium]
MEPRIETIGEMKLIGQHLTVTILENKTFELWRSFMLRRKEITSTRNAHRMSMEIYHSSFEGKSFHPESEYEK